MIFSVSLAFYLVERHASRFEFTASQSWEFYVENFASSLLDRRNFAGPLTAIAVMAVYALVAGGMCLVMLSALTILSYETDTAALALVCASFGTEVLYTLARFGRFKEITEQGWPAAYAASLHSTFTTTVSVPTVVVYVVMIVSRVPEGL